ncbi:asparagine synthetase B family protein [Psychroserpens jangbogonensis]|uniref:asparagine synthase-related protein n=1 Tax=Psychroserpens jangbogonensis TaxID=1484460 RepID=UPI00053EF27C|nr:asparagine synthetase B family protein [Psychroserpens jangbogonensis]
MSYSIKNSIPAFGGLTSSKGLNSNPDMPSLNGIYLSDNLRLYSNVNMNTTSDFGDYYSLDDKSFLWTGGYKTKANQSLDNFDYQLCEHKFIYLRFDAVRLELFSDHFSKIPLFYSLQDDVLFFASSLNILLTLKKMHQIDIDNSGLLFYYHYGFSNYNNYLVKTIKSVSGGQRLSFSLKNSSFKQNAYFDIFRVGNYSDNSNTLHQNIQLIDQELLKSTKETIASFNQIGIALSGGVDSGYLAQKINESGRDFNAYTLGFKDDYNEFDRIDYLSEKLNFKAKKIIIDSKEIIDNYVDVSNNSSFPVGFNNSILNIIYKHATADNVDIMFDGDGADRLFLGMNKYLQLQQILNLYKTAKNLKINGLMAKVLSVIKHPSASKLSFYFKKFNEGYPFYGERKLSNEANYVSEFEIILNNLALPKPLKKLTNTIDGWLFFSLFSVYYTPAFFFHTPYELQLKHKIVSNPQFWSDEMVSLALSIPVNQKLHKQTTKMVLRESAKLKIDDGYWNLSKIGLQNSYEYIKKSKIGKEFINDHIKLIKMSEAYFFLKENNSQKQIEAERLLPFYFWKKSLEDN